MSKPRVLHFIESGGLYGAERVILNLSREMQAQGEFEPVIGCIVSRPDESSDLYDAALEQGTEATKLVIPNRQLLWALPLAAKGIRRLKIDLIHSHGYKPSVYSYIIRLLTRIKVMATCHLWFEPENAPLKTRLMMGLEKRFYRRFPKVVGVSDPIRKVLVDAGVPKDRVSVVENGVDMATTTISDDKKHALRLEFGIGEGDYCLLNAARLTRQKAQWTLVDAAAILRDEGISFRLLIVGEGALEQELKSRIQNLELDQQVVLTGFRKDINAIMAISDLFLLPSLDEGMPMSLLEAVSAKRPVISTAVGDIPKLIRHQDSGLLVEPEAPGALARQIIDLLQDPERGAEMARRAQEYMATRYSQQAMGTHYRHIYQELLSRRGFHAYV